MMPLRQTINWDSPLEAFLTMSKDLCHLFDPCEPWHPCLRSAPVRIVPERILHIMEGEADGRLEIFRRRPDLIYNALECPSVIEAEPRYMDEIDHHAFTYLTELDDDDKDPHRYIAVAVNLANPVGMLESDHHYVRTCYLVQYRNIFKADSTTRQRWKRAK